VEVAGAGGVGFDALAQAVDVDVYGAGIAGGVQDVCSDRIEETGAGEGHAGVAGEVVQQVELTTFEVDGLAVYVDLTTGGIDGEAADGEHAGNVAAGDRCFQGDLGFGVGHAGASQVGFDAGEELRGAEGLGDVIVGANFEADDAVDFVYEGADEDDGATQLVAQEATDLKAIHATGEEDVQQNEIGWLGAGSGETGRTVAGSAHLETGATQVVRQRLAEGTLVFDDEDALELHPPRTVGPPDYRRINAPLWLA
jgi:hypothetical protein